MRHSRHEWMKARGNEAGFGGKGRDGGGQRGEGGATEGQSLSRGASALSGNGWEGLEWNEKRWYPAMRLSRIIANCEGQSRQFWPLIVGQFWPLIVGKTIWIDRPLGSQCVRSDIVSRWKCHAAESLHISQTSYTKNVRIFTLVPLEHVATYGPNCANVRLVLYAHT